MAYIDTYKQEHGVEPICRELQVAPSTYYAAKARPPSARQLRDAEMEPKVLDAWTSNRRVYGAHKLWKQLRAMARTSAGTMCPDSWPTWASRG